MTIEAMFRLIRQVWSDSMSDDGSIWDRSNAELKTARAKYPDIYEEALTLAHEAHINQF